MIKSLLKYIDKKIFNNFISKSKNFFEKKIKMKKIKNEIFDTQIYYSHTNDKLSQLCDKFGTDKGFVNLDKRIFYIIIPIIMQIFIRYYLTIVKIIFKIFLNLE